MKEKEGKYILLEALKKQGVKYIFGNPGTTETAIMDALESYPEFEYILTVQESVAMGMADAYARATKKPAFVNLHIETGLANGLSLLHNAHSGGTPLVLSAGNKDSREIAPGKTDLIDMVSPFTKWAVEVNHPDAIAQTVQKAFRLAMSPPTGPTFVAFTTNALDDKTGVYPTETYNEEIIIKPNEESIDKAAELLVNSNNIGMLIGDRIVQISNPYIPTKLAELLGAKVYSSNYSEMIFPNKHPNYINNLKLGFNSSNEFDEFDTVLAIGGLPRVSYMFSNPKMRIFNPKSKLIHIDNDPSQVGTTEKTDIGIISDPSDALKKLTIKVEELLKGNKLEFFTEKNLLLKKDKEKSENNIKSELTTNYNNSPMTPDRMVSEIANSIPKNTIIVNDAVTTANSIFKFMNFEKENSIFGGRGGSLGWGMGGALGTKLAFPNENVIAIVGDGTGMMSVQALWTASTNNIPITYIMCNNSTYKVLKLNMDIYKEQIGESKNSQYMGMNFDQKFDFKTIAKSFNIDSYSISKPEEIGDVLKKCIASQKPNLIDIHIDG
ncbi:MAG: thiamine pyrophosphate-binding protein [Dehalococcoidia bacterium]